MTLSDKTTPKQVEADINASPTTLDLSVNNPIVSSYTKYVPIKRIKLSKEQASIIDDTTNKTYRVSNRRSTAEPGGQNTVNKLEFKNIDSFENVGIFERIILALREIKLYDEILYVDCKIGFLSEYRRWGAFTTLDDAETKRKYLVAQIVINDGRKAIILELEGENKALATLLLVGSDFMNTSMIADTIIKGTIKRSGAWPYDIIIRLADKHFFSINKFRHTNVSIEKLADRILSKICH